MLARCLRLLAVVAAVGALLVGGPGIATAQTVVRPGPGLGDSTAAPQGRPVDLTLPPGYTLVGVDGDTPLEYTRACYLTADRGVSPWCSLDRGVFTLSLVLRFQSAAYVTGLNANEGRCPGAMSWGGWVLPSQDNEAQNILVPTVICQTAGNVTPVFTLPPPTAEMLASAETEVRFPISGYCLNLSRSVPNETNRYTTGVISRDPGLTRIVNTLIGKNLYDQENRAVIQDVVWDYTDGSDGLTQGILNRLASLR